MSMTRVLTRLAALAGVLALAACAEKTDTTAACPALCADPTLALRDTVLDAVVADTSMGDFPVAGAIPPALDPYVVLANRPDTSDVRLAVRFDTLPVTRSATDTARIDRLRNTALLLFVDTTVSVRPAGGATIELFDVDTSATNDSLPDVVRPLFRDARRLGARTFTRAQLVDTLRIPMNDAFVLDRIQRGARLRVGVRVTAGTQSVSLRVLRPGAASRDFVPRVFLDPSPDSVVRARTVLPASGTPTTGSAAAYRHQQVVFRGTAPLGGPTTLDVGGLPAQRALLRFEIPRRFVDSSTIVRATLDLVQRPRRDVPGARDSVNVRARLVTAGRAITDVRTQLTLLNPTLEGTTTFPPVTIIPADSGLRTFDLRQLLAAWNARADTLAPTSLVLVSDSENGFELPVAFWSREAPQASLRPRLRLTYTPRRPSVLP